MFHNEQPGDRLIQDVSMPVNKNELMLLGLALREYRFQVQKNHRDLPSAARATLIQELISLEQKVISNEISWNELYGKS